MFGKPPGDVPFFLTAHPEREAPGSVASALFDSPPAPLRISSTCSAMCLGVGQSNTVVDDMASSMMPSPETQPSLRRRSCSLLTNSSAEMESKPASNSAWSGEIVRP